MKKLVTKFDKNLNSVFRAKRQDFDIGRAYEIKQKGLDDNRENICKYIINPAAGTVPLVGDALQAALNAAGCKDTTHYRLDKLENGRR